MELALVSGLLYLETDRAEKSNDGIDRSQTEDLAQQGGMWTSDD